LELLGRNLTVASITDLIAHGVIENTSTESGYSGTFTLTVNNTADCTYSGILRNNNGGSGTIAVAKTGSGTLTLSGGGSDDNIRYTGGTTVSGGSLVFRDILYCPIVSRNVTLSNNASLVIDSAADFSGVISGAGTLTKKGNGGLTLSGSGNTYTGATTMMGGSLSLSKSSGYAIPGDIIYAGSSQTFINLKGDNQIPPTAKISFTGSNWQELKLLGRNLTVAGISDATGKGVIENTWDETGAYALATLTVDNSAECSYNGQVKNTYVGSGLVALTKSGAGKLTMLGTGVGQYTGGLTVNNGTLDYSGGTLPACNYTINGGTLNIGSQTKVIGAFKIVGGTVSGTTGTLFSSSAYDIQAGTVSARLSGTSIALNKAGEGSAVLSGANSYTGATAVSGGILQANSGAGLPSSSYLKLDGGILQGYGSTAVSFLRVLSSTVAANNFQWTAAGGGFAAGPAVLTVRIGGTLNPVNWGDAAGANIAGALKLNSATSANVVDFQNGINLNGKIRTILVEDNPSSTLDFAAVTGPIADGSGVGGILKTGAGTLKLTGALTYTGNTVIDGGTLQINSPTATLSTISGTGKLGIGSSANLTAASINVDSLYIGTTPAGAAVPEPSALVLMLGAVVAGFAFWKRNA
jgi:fibronectin-binding autotransporter adhesin